MDGYLGTIKGSTMLSDEEVKAITSKKYQDLTDYEKVIYGMGYRHAKEILEKVLEAKDGMLSKANAKMSKMSSDHGLTMDLLRDAREQAEIASGRW